MTNVRNPFFLEDDPGATMTQGWYSAWNTAVSPFAVAAESAQDVAAAVDFARTHDVRLVVKGTGHDYLGRSNAPDSLLVWTHRMRSVVFDQAFRPAGSSGPAVPALSIAAGARWLEAYKAAADSGHYVQGGGCTSVGASGGFIQGSGFGSFSKRFGTGAGGVLEFEVVTADGEIRVANASRNPDLFWALRGGGGGTWGIVTRTTLLAHPIPDSMGVLGGTITAQDDAAFRELLLRLSSFLHTVNNPSWGEQITITSDNKLDFGMVFLDLTEQQARATWQPLLQWVANQGSRMQAGLTFATLPFKDQWNAEYWDGTNPRFINHDPRQGAPPWRYWWASNQNEVSWYIASYQSRWLPVSFLDRPQELADLMFEASRHNDFSLHFNKGLAGESPDARARDVQTCLNPAAFDAAALIIVASGDQQTFPGVPGFEPNSTQLEAERSKVDAATNVFRAAMPQSGSYANEADYFETDWQNQFWGTNYERLLAIKRKYDPGMVFRAHHGVGSDL